MRYGTYLKSPPCPPGGVLLLVSRTAMGLAGEDRYLRQGLAGEESIFFGDLSISKNGLLVWSFTLILTHPLIYIISS